ncbi:galactose-1-phosphate uridylyltransferase, variant 1 [Puccinia striiformis f. sp. tritici PST-78]|uniref:Galactose-1-phosphate uridylyltransferase n=2 Tax=Puccinia striiformis f. sp. tritici TaxID=168172 RepID=A0A0L0VQP6_9BASI|nr:galactose-1-phosphate uridylyltransferase [Puccinia striiformis f. sp. tritici PST-78]KNF01596.1 galactose-1-phosphate uridylyltransferase, variant 1 [Puccinia striiformis f. sp. tritici PST-78]
MQQTFDPTQHPHRRFNPLTHEWVICSPHRNNRPWQGQIETNEVSELLPYDPKCFLCPNNTRAGGQVTNNYTSTYFFENDFAAMNDLEVSQESESDPLHLALHQTEPARGKCFVICYNPRHDLTMAELSPDQILPIINAWIEIYTKIKREHPFIKYIQIFENKGAMMGCSNPHPHGQVWALSYIPTIPTTVLESQENFANSKIEVPDPARLQDGRPSLLLSYAHSELNPKPSARVLHCSEFFLAVVPFWATWPFEVLILPHSHHISSLLHLPPKANHDLAIILSHVTRAYDNLFQCSFPYSMAIFQAPPHSDASSAQVHISFCPPLLRSATIRKFLVGFEMFGEAQRDLTPELAAEKLRAAALEPYHK